MTLPIPSREVLEADGARHADIAVPSGGEQREAEIGYAHEDEAEQHRALEAHARIEDAADEDADQIGPETHADIEDRNLIIGEAEIVEQQAQRQIGERVADLVKQDEGEHEPGALAREEIGERSPDRLQRLRNALAHMFHRPAGGFTHQQRRHHGRKGADDAGQIGDMPVGRSGRHTQVAGPPDEAQHVLSRAI